MNFGVGPECVGGCVRLCQWVRALCDLAVPPSMKSSSLRSCVDRTDSRTQGM